jgi:hypothetical protein
MLIALVILLAYLNPLVRLVAAVLGGIGLGFLSGELGKFLTSDNNYLALGFLVDLFLFISVRYMLDREQELERSQDEAPQSAPALAGA